MAKRKPDNLSTLSRRGLLAGAAGSGASPWPARPWGPGKDGSLRRPAAAWQRGLRGAPACRRARPPAGNGRRAGQRRRGPPPRPIACYSKGLPHDAQGEPDRKAYDVLLKALQQRRARGLRARPARRLRQARQPAGRAGVRADRAGRLPGRAGAGARLRQRRAGGRDGRALLAGPGPRHALRRIRVAPPDPPGGGGPVAPFRLPRSEDPRDPVPGAARPASWPGPTSPSSSGSRSRSRRSGSSRRSAPPCPGSTT